MKCGRRISSAIFSSALTAAKFRAIFTRKVQPECCTVQRVLPRLQMADTTGDRENLIREARVSVSFNRLSQLKRFTSTKKISKKSASTNLESELQFICSGNNAWRVKFERRKSMYTKGLASG